MEKWLLFGSGTRVRGRGEERSSSIRSSAVFWFRCFAMPWPALPCCPCRVVLCELQGCEMCELCAMRCIVLCRGRMRGSRPDERQETWGRWNKKALRVCKVQILKLGWMMCSVSSIAVCALTSARVDIETESSFLSWFLLLSTYVFSGFHFFITSCQSIELSGGKNRRSQQAAENTKRNNKENKIPRRFC